MSRGGDALGRSFDALWGFDTMVATLAEVRRLAPNELVANLGAYGQAAQACAATKSKRADAVCVDKAFKKCSKDLPQRIAALTAAMERRAAEYRAKYLTARRRVPKPGTENTFTTSGCAR